LKIVPSLTLAVASKHFMGNEIYLGDTESDDDSVVIAMCEFCVIFGGCEKCPGWGTLGELRLHSKMRDFEPYLAANQLVFCTHWCHEAETIV
jgi:hypothetical protein